MKPDCPLEIERKFLIAFPDVSALAKAPGCTVSRITQTYLLTEDGSEMRVRRRENAQGVRYIQTVKRPVNGMTREEQETAITKEAYLELLSRAAPSHRPIQKTRYALPLHPLVWEIDVYPFWQDRAIAEVELQSEDQPVAIPPLLSILREVTHDPAYKNSALARRLPE